MEILLVTGISGGGKSQAIKFLEDIGYFCMDNIPIVLLPKIYELFNESETCHNRIAFVTDIRNREFLHNTEDVIRKLKANKDIKFSMLFMECSDAVILNRYKEHKRRHPIADDDTDNAKAVAIEREYIGELKDYADYVIDTSNYSIWDLKREITKLFGKGNKQKGIKVECMSFGFKHGIPTLCDLVFDVRFLPNPYYVPELKNLTGLDEAVRDYVFSMKETQQFMKKLTSMLKFLLPHYEKEGKDVLVVGIGCTGGRHRSVALTEALKANLAESGYSATSMHRDMNNDFNHRYR
ncbi:MAG: RNase adapter RapZ [Ruminococcaceae bacterium]|nr:RNase adapter RapZ [Oscillospiraceae bacterium]